MIPKKITKGTLAVVKNVYEKPPHSFYWGLVIDETRGGLFVVQIGKTKEDTIMVLPENVEPVVQTARKFQDPEEAVNSHQIEIFLDMFLNVRGSRQLQVLRRYKRILEKEPKEGLRHIFRRTIRRWLPRRFPQPAEINPSGAVTKATLVAVKNIGNKLPAECLGLVRGNLPSGNFDVQVGKDRKDRIPLPIEELEPIIQTENNYEGPEEAFRAHLPQIFLNFHSLVKVISEIETLRKRRRMVGEKIRRKLVQRIIEAMGKIPSL